MTPERLDQLRKEILGSHGCPTPWVLEMFDEVKSCHKEIGRLTEQLNGIHHKAHDALPKPIEPVKPIRFTHEGTMPREHVSWQNGAPQCLITYDLLMRGPDDKLFIVSKETGQWEATLFEPRIK